MAAGGILGSNLRPRLCFWSQPQPPRGLPRCHFVRAAGTLERLDQEGYCLHPQWLEFSNDRGDRLIFSATAVAVPRAASAEPWAARSGGDHAVAEQGGTKPKRRPRVQKSNRANRFAKWLVDTFGRGALCAGAGVLDVAGGSGELSYQLAYHYGIPTTTIDPRPPKLSKQQLRQLEYRREWRRLVTQAPTKSPLLTQLLSEWLEVTPSHVTALFLGFEDVGGPSYAHLAPAATGFPETPVEAEGRGAEHEAQWRESLARFISPCGERATLLSVDERVDLLLQCSAIVGLHPDQPTAAITDCAVALGKPWAVIPCCVFPNAFFSRRTCGHFQPKAVTKVKVGGCGCAGAATAEAGGPVPPCHYVRKHAQLCAHLAARANGTVASVGFDGQDVVVSGVGRPPPGTLGAASEET